MSNELEGTSNVSYESTLIKFIAKQSLFNNSYDVLAKYLSDKSGKTIQGRKFTFMARNEAYAKKWLKVLLLDVALEFGYVPQSKFDWHHCVWTITGTNQSLFGGNNSALFETLAEKSDKSASVFHSSFTIMLEENNYGRAQ